MHTCTPIVLSLLAASALAAPPHLEARKGGAAPVGGPASAKVTVYSSYTCAAPNTAPPTDGSAGTATSFTIAEGTCTIPSASLMFGGAISATLSATPKTGTVGCYILGHSQQGCGITLTNYLHGWPFDGISVGNSVGCGNAPAGTAWGAFEVLCV
ncbi:hypothetical protein E4T44_05614 [Aureobasidium sp. EXF-8845]|nr:hypothetical protein E4T44_05614 [Aureobasidium sp. EXF-8845]KAI4850297.1 hypothetical protein E4T45_05557 [Aureobasidium sp. EXF-8846]